MSADAKATAYLELNLTGFNEAIATAKKAIIGLGALFAADKIKDFFVDGTKDAIDFGNSIYFASQKLGGFDAGNLLIVDKAFEAVGLNADEANAKIGEFMESHRDISSIFGGAEKYASALQQASKVYGSQADILSNKAEAFAKVFQTLEEVGGKMKAFFLGAVSEFLEPLEAILEQLNDIDLAGVGKSFGDSVANAIETIAGLFKQGKFLSTLKEAFIIAIKTAIEYAAGGIKYIGQLLIPMIEGSLASIPWGDIGKEVLISLASFGDWLINLMKKAAAALAAGLTWAMNGLLNFLPEKLRKWLTGSGEKQETDIGKIYKDDKAGLDSVMPGEHAGYNAAKDLFGGGQNKEAPKFARERIFGDLDKQTEALSATFKAAQKAGEGMVKVHSDLSKSKINNLALTKPDAFKGIGDSLAKIGGGGGFIRTGLNLQERTAMQQLQVAKESNTIQKEVASNTRKAVYGGRLN
jgi:hypothetical protein